MKQKKLLKDLMKSFVKKQANSPLMISLIGSNKFLTKEEVIKIEADYKRESDLLIQELKSMRKEYIEIKRGIIKENLSLLDKSSKDVEKRIINHLGGKPYSTYEIQEMLSHKADKTKMIFLDDLKADKVELEN